MTSILQNKIEFLPETPGVYQFVNSENNVIYVGKAKNLKSRVSSYFLKSNFNPKVRIMLKHISDVEIIKVPSEHDALLLENSLIKKMQPRYNVLLKDDKTFPWICIKNERFPRIFKTRKFIQDGSEYYGPYTSGYSVKIVLDLIREMYKLRSCTLNLSQESIDSGKHKVCLEYHIGNCKSPCISLQNENDYNDNIVQIKKILNGNLSELKSYLFSTMLQFSRNYQYEEAQIIKKQIEVIEKFKAKSVIVNSKFKNIDVVSIVDHNDDCFVNFLKVSDGAIVQSHNLEIKRRLDESNADILAFAYFELRERFKSNAPEVIVSEVTDLSLPDVKFLKPQKGEKFQLVELSLKNALSFKFETLKRKSNLNLQQRSVKLLDGVKNDLNLIQLPVRIECFDNSNLQGTNPVAACVVFINGKPAKKEYRHFNIKTVEGANDYATMEEVVYRRYKRIVSEGGDMPQLIVIDGGKGQLSSAYKALSLLDIQLKPEIIGIAKRLEEIFKPGDNIPLYLDKNSPTLKLIQNIRDEAHRFGITFHRNKRSKYMVKSELENIPGIGKATIEKVVKQFGSLKGALNSGQAEVTRFVGKAKSELIFKYLNTNGKE